MPHPAPAADPALLAPVPADHAAHDTVLIAAYAAGDAEGVELEAATALVAACTACAALHRDLRAIAAALPEMPAPRRTRDFRLTPGQADSLRPAGWRRLLAPFAGPRFAFAAPLGSGLAALGIVGILLAGTGLPLGGVTSAPAPAEAVPAAAPTAGPVAGGSPSANDGQVGMTGTSAAPAPGAQVPVTAPQGNAGAVAPDSSAGAVGPAAGVSTAGTDKNAVPSASPASPPGAAAGGSPAASSEGPGEAVRVMGERDQGTGSPENVMLLLLAAVMTTAGVALAGLRVLSRRVA